MAVIIQPDSAVYVTMPAVVIKEPTWITGEPVTIHIEIEPMLQRVFTEELGGEGGGVAVITGQIWPRKGTI
jgi:hypothetical protein